MIKFDVCFGDLADSELVARYWATDEDGKFVEKVNGLLPYRGISKSHQLLEYIQGISFAWDERYSCSKCAQNLRVRSRSDVQSKAHNGAGICDACEEKEKLERKQVQKTLADELNKRLEDIARRNQALTVNYEAIPDDVALILIALDNAINPRLITGAFRCDECRGLAPGSTNNFLQKLWDAGVIIDQPSLSPEGAYFLKDGDVWHYRSKAAYSLVADETLGRTEETLNALRMRVYKQLPLIRQLWLDYALSDCMAYLYEQCALHRLEIGDESDPQVRSILRTALETYSVAQLWSVIWKVVRDAASLSAREYYNQAKAAATISGKIKRHLERVAKGTASAKVWSRPVDQPAGTLGDLFYEYFGVDEDTLGTDMMEAFTDPDLAEHGAVVVDPPEEVIEGVARTMMLQASTQGLEATALLFFADCIRSGDDVKAALDAVLVAYPMLAKIPE